MIKVKKIIQCGDGSCEEADVIVTDGQFELMCFCHPCTLKEGQEIIDLIRPLDTKDLVRSDESMYVVKKLNNYFDYSLTGKIVNKAESIVTIGDIKIEVGYIPADIREGEFVSFYCNRLDI